MMDFHSIYIRFLLLCAAPLLYSCAHGPREAPDPKFYEHIVIVGTNDFHGYLRPVEADFYGSKTIAGGAEWFAAYVRILEKKYGNNLVLLDGGDLFQGTMESNIFKGKSVMEYYNSLPYRAAAIGNHEFDYGPMKKGDKDKIGILKERMKEAKFPFLSANIFYKNTKTQWTEKNLYPHTIFSIGNIAIGVIGLTTETTAAKTLPQYVAKLDFRSIKDAVAKEAHELRAKGVNLVFVAAHEGGDKEGEPIYEMLAQLPQGTVDAVVAGHSHKEIRVMIRDTPVIEAYTRGRFFGRIDLFVNKKTKKVEPKYTQIAETTPICGTWFATKKTCDAKEMKEAIRAGRETVKDSLPLRTPIYEGEEVKADISVRNILKPYFSKVEILKKEVLGYASEDFQFYPSGENDVGILFAHGLLKKFPQAKAVYLNGGGFRRLLTKGPVTYGDIYEVMPFDNKVALVQMTGREFKEMLKLGVSGAQTVPAVAGALLSFHNNNNDSYLRDVNGDGKKDIWERDRLIEANWSNGSTILDSDKFWIITNDYLVQGGDNMDSIFSKISQKNIDIRSLDLRDAMAEFLRTHKKEYLPLKMKPSIKLAGE